MTLRRARGSIQRLIRWRSPRSLFVLVIACGVPCAAQIIVDNSYHPFYAAEGDLARHTFWDGVLESLEYNPDWAAKYGASVNEAKGDEMPLAAARLAIAKLPPEQRPRYLNGDGNPTRIAYEAFSRSKFLEILWNDPAFVLQTYLIAKPLRIQQSVATIYQALFRGLAGPQVLIVAAALLGFVWLAVRNIGDLKTLGRISVAAFLCACFAGLPNWLVSVNELVMFDNLIWALLCITLMPVIAAVALTRLIRIARREVVRSPVPYRDWQTGSRASVPPAMLPAENKLTAR